MGNALAYLVIITWPVIILFLIKRYGFVKSAFLSLISAYLFLPAGFSINIPGIPAFNKMSVTSMTLAVYLLLTRKPLGYKSLPIPYKVLIIAFIVAPFFTVFNNPGSYMFLPGLTYYDGLSSSVNQLIYIIPFLIGFQYFRSYENQMYLFKVFAVSAIIYALLALYEIRMSPQLHNIVYGYFPHSWLQQVRGDGYRAVVFMGHGLVVALFLAIGLGVWTVIWKNKQRILPVTINNIVFILFILLTLVLMKSLAALIFGVFLFIMIHFVSTKRIHQISVLIALIFMTYPITSAMKVFPHEQILNIASSIDADRAGSLEFRFKHEEMLLAHAEVKPLFGWGGWGRNRVYDPETGEDISVTDGKWIITLGIRGWFGFLAEFLLIVLPIWAAYKVQKYNKKMGKNERVVLAAHALIVSIILIDQLPNASMSMLYLFLVGALGGRVYGLFQEAKKNQSLNTAENNILIKDQTV